MAGWWWVKWLTRRGFGGCKKVEEFLEGADFWGGTRRILKLFLGKTENCIFSRKDAETAKVNTDFLEAGGGEGVKTGN